MPRYLKLFNNRFDTSLSIENTILDIVAYTCQTDTIYYCNPKLKNQKILLLPQTNLDCSRISNALTLGYNSNPTAHMVGTIVTQIWSFKYYLKKASKTTYNLAADV